MRSFARTFVVACLTAAFITIPFNGAWAGEREVSVPAVQSRPVADGKILRSAMALAPAESRMMLRQTVATTNESKLLVGIVAGSAIVAGLTMATYGATASCKGRFGSSTKSCDRLSTIGAITVGGGGTLLLLWALSR